jgi:hypothetical protein
VSNNPETLPAKPARMSADDVAGFTTITKILATKEQARHERKMDVIAYFGALGIAAFCLVAAFVLAIKGYMAGCAAFLGAPVATAMIMRGWSARSGRKPPGTRR